MNKCFNLSNINYWDNSYNDLSDFKKCYDSVLIRIHSIPIALWDDFTQQIA